METEILAPFCHILLGNHNEGVVGQNGEKGGKRLFQRELKRVFVNGFYARPGFRLACRHFIISCHAVNEICAGGFISDHALKAPLPVIGRYLTSAVGCRFSALCGLVEANPFAQLKGPHPAILRNVPFFREPRQYFLAVVAVGDQRVEHAESGSCRSGIGRHMGIQLRGVGYLVPLCRPAVNRFRRKNGSTH